MKSYPIPPDYYDLSLKSNFLQRLYHERKFGLAVDFLGKTKGRVLDVGCASGIFAERAGQNVKGEIWGIDINPDFIAFAQKTRPGFKFLAAAVEKLPFPGSKFDVVACLEVLEHLPNPRQALLEMNRVLKKGGRLLVAAPKESFLFRFLWFWWLKGKGRIWQGAHLQRFTGDSLEKMIAGAGFEILRRRVSHLGMLQMIKAQKL